MKKSITAILLSIITLSIPLGICGQSQEPYSYNSAYGTTADPAPTTPPPTDPDPGAPIDGGLGLLLAAGAAYGVKKYKEYKRNVE